jgi:hypothetical protein
MREFPRLAHLMRSRFHQDFDLDGDTLEAIIGAYRAVTPLAAQRELMTEIREFLASSPDVDRDFDERFNPEIETTAFAASTRDFLEKIATLVDGAI